tara:strand:+ start:4338 stop:4604 length:267 start_codon:yes stop_codon:yes gene_type:complete
MDPKNLLFAINQEFNDVPKMNKFISNRYHITFETADSLNKTWWFECAKNKGYLKAMIAHRDSTSGVFEWTNFNKWLESINTDEDIPPE